MTLEQAGILTAIATSVGGFLIAHLTSQRAKVLEYERVAKIELKCDTMWEFMMRRAGGEAVSKGLATFNSPLKIHPHALEILQGMKDDLLVIYRSFAKPISDCDLMFEIERQLGSRLVKEICIPNCYTLGECLVVAAAVAKESDTVTLPADLSK
jgi:hypothetical protein